MTGQQSMTQQWEGAKNSLANHSFTTALAPLIGQVPLLRLAPTFAIPTTHSGISNYRFHIASVIDQPY